VAIEGREMALLLAPDKYHDDRQELAELVGGVDDSAVAQDVRRFEKRIQEDSRLGCAFKILRKEIATISDVKT
jgi:hypothetical protein